MEINEWREIWSFESLDSVQLATVQVLEASGILTVPRGEPGEITSTKKGSVFGVPLDDTHQPLLGYSYGDFTFQLPRLFVELAVFLERCPSHEGVFRKSGSVSRQKALRSSFECGDLTIPPETNIHDVASLLKQYLRELPDLLLTQHFSPVYEACHALLPDEERKRCILLTCLLLPRKHCQMLSVLMKLLNLISEKADQSLMNASNLSVVMAPNLMKPSNTIMVPTCNPLQTQTDVVKLLIENWNLIGRVPPDVGVASEALSVNLQAHSLDDIIKGEGPAKSLPQTYRGRKARKKQRTASISGLVLGLGSRLKQKGVALTSGDYHMTSRGLQRKTSVKRKTRSHEDLLLPNKRPAIQRPTADHTGHATPMPHPLIKPVKPHSIHLCRQHSHTDQPGKTLRGCREPVRAFKPSLTVKLDFVKQDKPVNETGQTGLTGSGTGQTGLTGHQDRQAGPTGMVHHTSSDFKTGVQANGQKHGSLQKSDSKTSSFVFTTPLHLPHSTIDPPSATPPHFNDPESEHIQVASFPLTPTEQKAPPLIHTPYFFSKPASFASKCNHEVVSCDKTMPTSPGNDLLDNAFLQTPFTMVTDHSPNLLDTISSEIAQRHNRDMIVTKKCPAGHFKVNESYKKAVRKGASDRFPHGSWQTSAVDLLVPTKPSLTQQLGNNPQSAMTGLKSEQRRSQVSTDYHGTLYEGTVQDDSDGLSQDSIVSDDVDVCVPRRLNLSGEDSAESADLEDGASKERLSVENKTGSLNCDTSTLSSMTSNSVITSRCNPSIVASGGGVVKPGRRHYTYSATLGMSMGLLTDSRNRQMVEQKSHRNTLGRSTADKLSNDKWYNVSLDESVPSPSSSNTCLIDSSYCSPSALSASLGITHFKNSHQLTKKATSNVMTTNSRVHTPTVVSHSKSPIPPLSTVARSDSPIPSPPPVLLHIVESNMLTNAESINKSQTDSTECYQEKSDSEVQDSQDVLKNAPPITENDGGCVQGNDQHIHDVPQVIEFVPGLVMGKLNSAKKKRNKDLLVAQAPSPRVPFGLHSPWLRPKKERQLTIRTTEDGRVTKRAQAYMVNGHQHRWRHAPLKRVTCGTTDVNNENCYHGNTGVAKRNISTKEWVV